MPRRSLFTPSERTSLLSFPEDENALFKHYTLNESDFAVINQHRGDHNRLGFAIQLCYLRYPGCALPVDLNPPQNLLSILTDQLQIAKDLWPQYSQRPETRREHLAELQLWLGLKPFTVDHHRYYVNQLTELAQQTDRGVVLAQSLFKTLREKSIIIPGINVVELICAEALTCGTRLFYNALTGPLSAKHRTELDKLIEADEENNSRLLIQLRQPPGAPNAKHINNHIKRLQYLKEMTLPEDLELAVHKNRLTKLAREGRKMTTQHISELEETRRYATLAAVVLDTKATLIDEIINLHDRYFGGLFNKAKRKHTEQFHKSGKQINDKLRLYSQIGKLLLEAKETGKDPFLAIESIMPWEGFVESITETEKLVQPEAFDYLPLISDGFSQLRRYTPAMLDTLQLEAAPAAEEILKGIDIIRAINRKQGRKLPEDIPTKFISKRWRSLIYASEGVDRRYYELSVYSEMKNSLRSGDLWIKGSRQFKNFDDYLLPVPRFSKQLDKDELGLPITTDCDQFLSERLGMLKQRLQEVEQLASNDELPDASITEKGLKISPLENAVPVEVDALTRKVYSLMPHLKITELLLEVDKWIGFSKHFTHLKSGKEASEPNLLLTAILADGINLGLTKMSESCPGATFSKLSWLQAWHIRDENYSAALADIVNTQFQQPFSAIWGDGTTSSSDGQHFRAGGRGEGAAHYNKKYGSVPGIQFYTHISDQYAPYYTQVINTPIRDATFVLDGLLNHESDLQIEEHYTDTAGFIDHVFGLTHLLGFRFAPRIRDFKDKRLYIHGFSGNYPTLDPLIGGTINVKHIKAHWNDILRLVASIKQGTVTSSLMLRKLGAYPRQNGLAVALRELGRIERTLFALDWMKDSELRRKVQVGLNKGEAKNALARAVFFNRLGELRDRSFENQRYRANGLNLVVSAIILWNTIYLDRAVKTLKASDFYVDDNLLRHLSPICWEHINLTGDYVWKLQKRVEKGGFRPLKSDFG